MHFALPPRKTSHPPLYARSASSSTSQLRKKQIQVLGLVVLVLLTFFLLLKIILGPRSGRDSETGVGAIEGPQDVVLVTMFDPLTMSENYMRAVKTNREDYAARHGKYIVMRLRAVGPSRRLTGGRIQKLLHKYELLPRTHSPFAAVVGDHPSYPTRIDRTFFEHVLLGFVCGRLHHQSVAVPRVARPATARITYAERYSGGAPRLSHPHIFSSQAFQDTSDYVSGHGQYCAYFLHPPKYPFHTEDAG